MDYGQSLYTGPQVGFPEGQFVHLLSVEVTMKVPEVVTEGLEEHRSEGKLNRFRLDEHGRRDFGQSAHGASCWVCEA